MLNFILSLASAYGAYGSFRAQAHYRALPEVADPASTIGVGVSQQRQPVGTHETQPLISIIIPARNEAHHLPRLLTSLVRQRNARTEIIVVDDASRDETGAIATGLGAHVLTLTEADRPAGWFGKPNACLHGSRAARGEWLLFLDADVELCPDAVYAAVQHANARGLDALSLFLQHRCESFWERLLLPYAFQQFFAGVDPVRLKDPNTDEAMLNGQFILIRASRYRDIGGHGSVRDSIVEDVALARTLKRASMRIETVRGERLGTVRMYHDLPSLRAGFGKNAYAFLANEPIRGVKVALTSTCASLAIPLLVRAVIARPEERRRRLTLFLAAWVALAGGLVAWLRQFRVPLGFTALQPVASLVFQSIAVESAIRNMLRLEVGWKGRSYYLRPQAPVVQVDQYDEQKSHPQLHPRLPLSLVPSLSIALSRQQRHSLLSASFSVAQALAGQWEAEGVDRIPRTGAVCLVVNHWQRPGLWVGWIGGLLGWLVSLRRPSADPPVRWLVTTEWRSPVLGTERHLFLLDTFLRRVTQTWGLIPLDPHPKAVAQRATALRSLGACADRGEVIGIFPEGHRGHAGRLGTPVEGMGRVLSWLLHRDVVIIPVGVHESAGRLIVRVGQPLKEIAPNDDGEAHIMHAVANLLPEALRGQWSGDRQSRSGGEIYHPETWTG